MLPCLEITEVVLVHCKIQESRIHFFDKKSFDQLLDISLKNCIFLKTFNSEFSYTEVWFTDQNSKPLETEDKISITLVIN